MNRFIVETDLGHDPDDFFAICWLVAIGVKIDVITLTPGDIDQIAIANFLRDELSLDCMIGVSKLDREKYSSGSVHYGLLHKYGKFKSMESIKNKHEGKGEDVIYRAHDRSQDFLVIGPATSTAKFISKSNYENYKFNLTMQGGFLPYSQNPYDISKLEKFQNLEVCQTFNFNGDIPAAKKIISTQINSKRFVGKHICHNVILDKEKGSRFVSNGTRAADLFMEGLSLLFERTDGKKFHDPLAAVASINLDPFKFVSADIYHTKHGWGAIQNPDSDCEMIADLNEEMFWDILTRFAK